MGKTMVSILLLALFYFVAILLPMTRGDLVADTCKGSPLPQLCISVLRADPRSKTADVAGLAVIVVDAIQVKSVATLNEINNLIGSNPSLKIALGKCANDYNAILKADIPESKEGLTKGNPKFAEQGVTDAGNEATDCEKGFVPSKSPLTASNNAVHDLSIVSEAIVRNLL